MNTKRHGRHGLRLLCAGVCATMACGDSPTGPPTPEAISHPIIYVTAGRIFATDTTGTDDAVVVDEQQDWLVLRGQWSPTGARILTTERPRSGGTWGIHVRTADGSGRVQVSDPIREPDSWPAWSPDGSRVTYTDRQLFVVNRDGTGHAAVSADSAFAVNPHWSPAGGWIVYHGALDGDHGVVRVRPDGSGREMVRVTGFDEDQHPRFSPDGRSIAFIQTNDLYVMDADGGNVRQLTFTPSEGDWWPRWSPNGRLIAHHTDAGSNWGVAVLDVQTTQRTDLFGDGSFETLYPAWAADSRRLAFDAESGFGIGILGADQEWLGVGPGSWPSWHPGL